ncbi:hypothetical protein JST99_00720 [Candidatus Dependentiae bacterium]|nr:hypothetical protein [Candidatus Dependentiae bacterium]
MTKNLSLRGLATLALCLTLSITARQGMTKYYAVNTTPNTVYVGLFTVIGGTITDYKTRKAYKLGPSSGVIKQYAAFDLTTTDNRAQQQFIFSRNLTDLETVLTTGQIPVDTKTIFMQEVGEKPVFEIGLIKKGFQHLFMKELQSVEKPKGAAVSEKMAEINVSKYKENERLLRRSKRAQEEEQTKSQRGQALHVVEEPQEAASADNVVSEEVGGVMFHSSAQPKAEAQVQQAASVQAKPVKSKSKWSLF